MVVTKVVRGRGRSESSGDSLVLMVHIVLEGFDKFNNLVGSVYYPNGDSTKDLALELVQNSLARYLDWRANMMEEDARRKLKTAELQVKKDRVRFWTNYIPPATNSKAIHDQNFTGKCGVPQIDMEDNEEEEEPLQRQLRKKQCPEGSQRNNAKNQMKSIGRGKKST